MQSTIDSLTIYGGDPKPAEINTYNDHRMAMAFAVAGLFAEGETEITGAECADVSFPGFYDALASVRTALVSA